LHESSYQQKKSKQRKRLTNSKHARPLKLSRHNTITNSNLYGSWNCRNRI